MPQFQRVSYVAYCATTHRAFVHSDFEPTTPASTASAERKYHLAHVPNGHNMLIFSYNLWN